MAILAANLKAVRRPGKDGLQRPCCVQVAYCKVYMGVGRSPDRHTSAYQAENTGLAAGHRGIDGNRVAGLQLAVARSVFVIDGDDCHFLLRQV